MPSTSRRRLSRSCARRRAAATCPSGPAFADALSPGGREQLIALFPGLHVERCEHLSAIDRGHGPLHRHHVLRLYGALT